MFVYGELFFLKFYRDGYIRLDTLDLQFTVYSLDLQEGPMSIFTKVSKNFLMTKIRIKIRRIGLLQEGIKELFSWDMNSSYWLNFIM